MKRSEAFPSKFLSKDDVRAPTVCIIEKVINETLGQGEDQEIKPVMYFQSGVSKPMVINNTNWMSVEDLYGDESDDWPGKAIEIWVDPSVSFGGKRIGGLRLRAPQAQPVAAGNNGGSAPLATGEQWEQFYAIAGQLSDAYQIDTPEPPDTCTAAGLDNILAGLNKTMAKAKAKAIVRKGNGGTEKALQELGFPPDEPKREKAYPAVWVKALIEKQLAENTFEATGMLNKAKLPEHAVVEEVLSWSKVYRAWRDSGKNPDESAELANKGQVPA